MSVPNPDVRIARIAGRQLGLITNCQARTAGLSQSQIQRRLTSGQWERLGRGVYRLLGAPRSDAQRVLAACLAGPVGCVAHGLTALSLFGCVRTPRVPTLIVPPDSDSRHPFAAVHRIPLTKADRTRVGGVPATVPARSVVDAAARLDEEHLADLVADVVTRRLTTPGDIARSLLATPAGRGRVGAARLRTVLEPWMAGLNPDSPGEARLLRRLAEWGFPVPVTQHWVTDGNGQGIGRLDLAWVDHRVGLEYDGRRWHTPAHLGSDEVRQARLEAAGWRVLRADAFDLRPSAERLRRELRFALSGRQPEWRTG